MCKLSVQVAVFVGTKLQRTEDKRQQRLSLVIHFLNYLEIFKIFKYTLLESITPSSVDIWRLFTIAVSVNFNKDNGLYSITNLGALLFSKNSQHFRNCLENH